MAFMEKSTPHHLHCPLPPDFARPPLYPPNHMRASVVPERSVPSNPSQYLKQWRLSTGVDGLTGVVDRATATRSRSGWLKAEPGATVPDKREQMLKMITALEELQRTFDGTLSSRITIVPRGNWSNADMLSMGTPVGWVSNWGWIYFKIWGCDCKRMNRKLKLWYQNHCSKYPNYLESRDHTCCYPPECKSNMPMFDLYSAKGLHGACFGI